MASELSVETIVSRLEAQIAFDREREAFHAGQEAFHREQRGLFAAEMEKLASILEAFKTAASTATELASRAAALAPTAPNLDIGRKPSLTRMVTRIIETRSSGDAFGTSLVAAEINRHYGQRLRRPVKEKLVSIILRRMFANGKLRSVREGRPHHEALYAKV